MKIPLERRLRKKAHVLIAQLQDEVVDLLYSISGRFVLHGGTAVWRCFGGGRFSEDIDLYAPNLPADFESRLREKLASRALGLQKFRKTANLVFCKVASAGTEVRIEVNFRRKVRSAAVPYERTDGSSLIVLCVPVDDLILEKAGAYASRRFVRDIYDVYTLSGMASKAASGELGKFINRFQAPLDEQNLQALVYSGAVPSFGQMLSYLKAKFP